MISGYIWDIQQNQKQAEKHHARQHNLEVGQPQRFGKYEEDDNKRH